MIEQHYECTKASELYTLKCLILCYANFTLIFLNKAQIRQFILKDPPLIPQSDLYTCDLYTYLFNCSPVHTSVSDT